MHTFHLLEVVDRGSETQLQVGQNLNKLPKGIRVNPLATFVLRTHFFNRNVFHLYNDDNI